MATTTWGKGITSSLVVGLIALGCGDAPPVSEGEGSSAGSEASTQASSTTEPAEVTTSEGTTTAPDSTGPVDPDTTTGPSNPLDDTLRLHHAQVKGTHNSYHLEPRLPFDPSHEYSHVPLSDQLETQGVRAFELDVHRAGDGTFEIYHIVGIDNQTTCDTLDLCLEQIKAWSDAHPQHLPIIVWLELKDDTGGQPLDTPEALQLLDDAVTTVIPPEQLLSPDDVQADYPTLRERLQTEGWPTLGELRGQILVTILDTDSPAEVYTSGYTTLVGKPLFVRADSDQLDLPWAAIAKLGIDETDAITAALAGNLIFATNVCGAGETDDSCFAARQQAIDAGFHMLKDDFPAPVPEREYWLDFPDGTPARCNPVTAPPECTSEALESL
jgi:hypothetical protein